MNGKEVAERIRQHNPNIPILFSSAFDFNILEADLSDKKATGFLQKPFSQSDLLKRVRELLDA